MARTYFAKNPWRKGSRQSEAEFDRIFFLMLRGVSISQIADRMSKKELMVRDNYDYIVDNIVGHDLSPFMYGFVMQFLPMNHLKSFGFFQEIAFWQRFPLHDEKDFYDCSFKCPLSPSLSEIRLDASGYAAASLKALSLKSRCAECPLKKDHGWQSRDIAIDDHAKFLVFMKRYRDIRFNRKFRSSLHLFRILGMMSIYQDWLKYIANQIPIEFVHSDERDRFVRYNLRALETALKRVSLASVAQRVGNHADLPVEYLEMYLGDRGGVDEARRSIADSRFDLFHYKDMLNFSWSNYEHLKESYTLAQIQYFLDREMARLERFRIIPADVPQIGTRPI